MNNNDKKASPPYVSYSSFRSFIKGLGETTVPSRIDKSIMSNYSGSVIYALLPALTWLKLIDSNGIPSTTLKDLSSADDELMSLLLSELVKERYDFLFGNGLDLTKATTSQVKEAFETQDVSGSTVSRCISFFLAIAKEAKITVSPHVKAPTIKRKPKPAKKKPENNQDDEPPEDSASKQDVEGMERIPIPLRGMENGAVYLPAGLEGLDAKRAVKVVKFLLEEYYQLDD